MKKLCIFVNLLFLFITGLFAQNNTPVGNWAKNKIGNSDYFLEITENNIKYVDKKTEGYIKWYYTYTDNEICFREITSQSIDTLNRELYKPLYEDNKRIIRFSRNGDKMTLYLNDEGINFITKEAKDKQIASAKKVGKGIVGALAVAGAAVLAYEATDTVASESEVKALADKVYKAAW